MSGTQLWKNQEGGTWMTKVEKILFQVKKEPLMVYVRQGVQAKFESDIDQGI